MTDSAIKYVGVDGCKEGWIGVGLDDGDGCPKVEVCKDFADLVACFGDACVILVDIPIGLLGDMRPSGRECDEEARKKLGRKRQSSVFSAPIRPLVDEVMKMENPVWWPGCGVNKQTFAIIPKIAKVDEALCPPSEGGLSKVQEAHPEVCFWALNGGKSDSAMASGKKTATGFWERFKTLRRCVRNVDTIVDVFVKVRHNYLKKEVADDDILDALALAITAKLGEKNGFRRLPKDLPRDCKKPKPPEMVYVIPPKGTPC